MNIPSASTSSNALATSSNSFATSSSALATPSSAFATSSNAFATSSNAFATSSSALATSSSALATPSNFSPSWFSNQRKLKRSFKRQIKGNIRGVVPFASSTPNALMGMFGNLDAQRREHARPKTEAELQIEADKNEEIQLKRKEKEETGMAEQEDVEDETDALQFETYEPAFTKGKPHPDLLVQAASLASVPLPELKYKLSLPNQVISKGLLSNAQLETVVLCCQKQEEMIQAKNEKGIMTEFRNGFYLGDGAGVGKGRQVAGLLLENVKARGLTKHVWISASADLIIDAKRDLEDLGITDELLACVFIKDIGYEKKNWNKLGGNVIFLPHTPL